ncbi:hypothetical protein H920_17220 [Fukomys damarensis]|uniref:Uncharacterized protein n=1 Tax=Fukomys damarensis TaxID=885580 RepID=A0A091CTU9_FUKDA|nr:hypothetical protein H920_17220 [Fukomys damarensis]
MVHGLCRHLLNEFSKTYPIDVTSSENFSSTDADVESYLPDEATVSPRDQETEQEDTDVTSSENFSSTDADVESYLPDEATVSPRDQETEQEDTESSLLLPSPSTPFPKGNPLSDRRPGHLIPMTPGSQTALLVEEEYQCPQKNL